MPVPTAYIMAARVRSAHGLNKRDFVDLFQSGKSTAHLVERRLAQEAHALFSGRLADLRRRPPFQNHLASSIRPIQKFMNRRPPPEAGSCAFDAALPLI